MPELNEEKRHFIENIKYRNNEIIFLSFIINSSGFVVQLLQIPWLRFASRRNLSTLCALNQLKNDIYCE